MDLTLLCWVCSDDIEDVFMVEIWREVTMGTLKSALKNEKLDTFRDVDVNTLKIYCLFIPSDADQVVELRKWRVHGKKPLDPDQQLSELFPKSHDGRWVVIVNYHVCSVLHDN
ncbi:hypothetical protein EDC04DRAFT_2580846 [Pisolithus marmoratus]|nr:hypothetical protein EDC04DRAFT_2580846 [Pisolithus marmoratus]